MRLGEAGVLEEGVALVLGVVDNEQEVGQDLLLEDGHGLIERLREALYDDVLGLVEARDVVAQHLHDEAVWRVEHVADVLVNAVTDLRLLRYFLLQKVAH